MNDKIVTVKVKLSLEDYIAMQKSYTGKLPILMNFFTFAIVVITCSMRADFFSPVFILTFVTSALALAASILFFQPRSYKKLWTSLYESSKDLQKECEYLFTSEGIEYTSNTVSAHYEWGNLHSRFESDEGFMVFTSINQCYYIPKKFIENNHDVDIIHQYLQNLPLQKRLAAVHGIIKLSFAIIGMALLFVLILKFFG